MTNLVLNNTNKLGIVLTPMYVAELMADIINMVERKKVIDLCCGTGNLLKACKVKINECEILGVEQQEELKNISHNEIKQHIIIADALNIDKEILKKFNPDALILNPPYNFKHKGMEFVEFGMKYLGVGDICIVLIQDSAGSGKSTEITKRLLTQHRLVASIKMPNDLFLPHASVQTSIYILQSNTPHNFDLHVKFIDFSNDGYKRNKRSQTPKNIDNAQQRYKNLLLLLKYGFAAVNQSDYDSSLQNINEVYIQDKITNSGNDWNFNQHKVIDTKPTLEDFKKTIWDYMKWEYKNGKPLTINLTEEMIKNNQVSLNLSSLFKD